MKRFTIISVAVVAACGGHPDHDTDPTEPPSRSITRWSTTHELFAEYPVLVLGRPARFAAHLTRLAGHDPITSGTLTIELRQADGSVVAATADRPARPGIFTPAPTPTVAGTCTLVFRYAGDTTDELSTDDCVVHAPTATPPPVADDPPGRIVFLKEQAWTTDLATALVAKQPLTPTLRATGELRAMAGREARITATTQGRLQLPAEPLVLGMPIAKGQVLATIVPRLENMSNRATVDAEVQAARSELATAERQLARNDRLWAARTIAERQLEESRSRVVVARAGLAAARARLRQFDAGASGRGGPGGFQIRSPIAGSLVAIHAVSGQSVEDSARLFTVVDLSRVWLHADVFEADIAKAAHATTATFRVDGYDELFTIAPPSGRVVTIGQLVDEKTRTVPLIFELDNPDAKLRIGSFATVFIATGAPTEALAIPAAAIVRDAGRPVAYVQVEGEAFERRVLQLGTSSGGWVEVRSGLSAGERVVVRGAYDVKLAASGGAVPDHGHAH